MIALSSDCLLFKTPSGESVPYSADMISIEFTGEASQLFDAEFVQHASKAVFHYFKHELRRQIVSVGEFAQALEKVLRGFALTARAHGLRPSSIRQTPSSMPSDLRLLAQQSGKACELSFFPCLREHLRHQLRQGHSILRFKGLRGCVKQMTGARRWSVRCRKLEEQIVDFLRGCLAAESPSNSALVVQ